MNTNETKTNEVTETKETKKDGFFQHNGARSMRRLLAFIFGLASIFCGIFSLVKGSQWQSALIAFAVPLAGSLLMMFFTSWTDIASVLKATKKD